MNGVPWCDIWPWKENGRGGGKGAYVFVMVRRCAFVVGSVEGSGCRWVYIGRTGARTL